MDFREFYRGICFRINFDSRTGIFTGKTDGLPKELLLRGESYDEVHKLFNQAVDDHLLGRRARLVDEWVPRAANLEQDGLRNEADELQKELAKIAAEMRKDDGKA